MQGTLSNIAAGMMLLWLRPFRVGDYIDTGSVAGTVKELGLFATELHSWDGIYQFVPNSELWNKKLINYSRLPTRLNDLAFGVDYDDDLDKGMEALLAAAGDDKRVMSDPAPQVFVDQLGDSAVVLRLRVWSANGDYWDVRRALTKSGKAALEAAGLSIPFPQRDLHLKQAPGAQFGQERGLTKSNKAPRGALSVLVMRSARQTACASFCLSRATTRLRIGLSTNRASATTTTFITAVSTNTMCQLPVEALIMLATGTRNAEAPLAV